MDDERGGFPFHHGRLSLSFLGTLGDRTSLRTERIPDEAALAAWLVAAGLVPRGTRVQPRIYAQARRLRDALEAAFDAALAKKRPPADAITTINAFAKKAPRRTLDIAFRLADDRGDPATSALARLADDAIGWLGDPAQRERLRTCGLDGCGSLFLTPTGRRERKWCSMARCGNRAKVSAFRERAHSA